MKLVVSSFGNPRDPATWSGTPSCIVAGLEASGVEVVAADVDFKTLPLKVLHWLLARAGGHRSWRRSPRSWE